MGTSVPMQKNLFDYELYFQTYDIVLYSFSDEHRCGRECQEENYTLDLQ